MQSYALQVLATEQFTVEIGSFLNWETGAALISIHLELSYQDAAAWNRHFCDSPRLLQLDISIVDLYRAWALDIPIYIPEMPGIFSDSE